MAILITRQLVESTVKEKMVEISDTKNGNFSYTVFDGLDNVKVVNYLFVKDGTTEEELQTFLTRTHPGIVFTFWSGNTNKTCMLTCVATCSKIAIYRIIGLYHLKLIHGCISDEH